FIIVAVLNLITILPAFFLNALVLISIWRTSMLHTPAMVLLGNLALSDLAVGIIAQPAVLSWTALELKAAECEKTYCIFATLFGILSSFFSVVSGLSITTVAVDRFLALYLHLKYQSLITMKMVTIVCIVVWFLAAIIGVSWILFGMETYNVIICSVMVICVTIILVCYFKIYNVMRKHLNQIQVAPVNTPREDSTAFNVTSSLKYKKSVIFSLYIYFAFVLCYMPCFAAFAYHGITGDNRFATFLKMSVTVVLMNSGMNPVIY
ncbi:predicted protein, partial [Nematostella vectensis]